MRSSNGRAPMLDLRNTPTRDLQLWSRPWAWSAATVSGSTQAPGLTPDNGWPEALSLTRNCTSANSPSRSIPSSANGLTSKCHRHTVTGELLAAPGVRQGDLARALLGGAVRQTPRLISATPTTSAQLGDFDDPVHRSLPSSVSIACRRTPCGSEPARDGVICLTPDTELTSSRAGSLPQGRWHPHLSAYGAGAGSGSLVTRSKPQSPEVLP